MIFKPMEKNLRDSLKNNLPDLLTEELKKEREFISKLQCIRCGEATYPILNTKQPFREGKLIPNTLVKCASCEVEFEPYTKIEVSGPKILDDLE